MRIKDLKIGTQLKLAFGAVLFFVIVLGAMSYIQTDEMQLQMEKMYNHPMQVRRAISNLRSNISTINFSTRMLYVSTNEIETENYINKIEDAKLSITEQIKILYEKSVGSKSIIDSFNQEFIKWDLMNDINIRLIQERKFKSYEDFQKNISAEEKQQNTMPAVLQKIDDITKNKADELYANSNDLNNTINHRILILWAIILLLIFIIYYVLIKNIHNPLEELTETNTRFHNGDLNARNTYSSKNEIGRLAASSNILAIDIQNTFSLNQKTKNIADIMLSEDDEKKFFHTILSALMKDTGSQIGAVYLRNENKKSFEHFDSIGGDENIKKTFSITDFEGEFGSALVMRAIQHLQDISSNTRFIFNTVSGKFIPNEIITIPILTKKNVIAVISLASINTYKPQSIQLINEIYVTMSARIEGIISYQKNKNITAKLELQNAELEAQKNELASQSATLHEQNTELEMQKKQLSEASQLKTNFLSNMSHELRTPLNSVIALSGVLNRRLAKKITEEENSYLEVIERNGKNLLALINDILDISRIESGREEIEITKFDANKLIAEIMAMIEPQAKQKNIELHQLPAESDIEIKTDAKKLQHILQNLIANAVKFTEKGAVEVKVEHTIKNIIITVSDSGIGIADEHIDHIFDEFRQADGSTSRKFGGTGLGLAIAKKYATMLGGSISVKSTIGKGSEFTVTLPVAYDLKSEINVDTETSDLKYPIKTTQIISVNDASTKTILLVEDSESAIIQMKDALEESSYKIIVAQNGEEALQIISNTIPDAMILDLMMPKIDGFQVLQTIRDNELTAHIPVLILTAKHITKDELKFLKRNNVHQLIQKGNVNREELMNAINSMVFPEPKIEKSKIKSQKIVGKPSVLVVEDNADNMITVKALLGDNFKIIEANDGKHGIDLAKQNIPNLILMDIALPDSDGIETFKAIRNNPALNHIPVIALTASAMVHDKETILAHGFDAYIAKPIDEKEFFKTINHVLYGE